MIKCMRIANATLTLAMVAMPLMGAGPAVAATAEEIDRDSAAMLNRLYEEEPKAKELGELAKGILVFPKIYKAGFIGGLHFGEGTLLVNGKSVGYYNSVEGSYGLQVGVQRFAYVLFIMKDQVLEDFQNSSGFELGVGPSVVVVDAGVAKSMTTTTLKSDIYAFIFNQKGLMAGLGVKGSKITKINK
ncbi:MAG TPA: lipid-binding SYLF domain-containing protein [Burkholderiales bacterium]|nr:lipid-binding SYLF domain-containing protein [Burkholderiales bacterium]